MAGIRVLADEHIKFTILTAKPANPAAPTAAELNAGLDASCLVLADNFQWSAADSERVGERALCEATAAESPGIGNYNRNVNTAGSLGGSIAGATAGNVAGRAGRLIKSGFKKI